MIRTRTALLAAAGALALITLPGCYKAATPVGTVPAQQQQPASLTLAATEISGIGSVATDSNGMTLYIFTKDKNKPSASNCNGDCAAKWPPMLATSETVAVQGIDQGLVGFVTRKDGTKQVTLNGWPLYQFAQDKAPGEAKGQGVGGTWFAVTPQGKKATAQAADEGYSY